MNGTLFSFAAAMTTAAAVAVVAAPPISGPKPGVVLLRNGRTFEGKIAREGDLVLIARPQGEIRLQSSHTEGVFGGYAECYRYKRARIQPDSLDDRLELAGWCITHGLLREAADEVSQAKTISPQHPRISLVQRRLEAARRPSSPQAAVRAEQEVPTDDEHGEIIERLPKGGLESFTSAIQPILQHHCATAGCHGPNSTSSFQLVRLPSGRPFTPLHTRRNLAAVLAMVDAASPKSSPLLTEISQAHGPLKGPVFSPREAAKFRQLAAWVQWAAPAVRTKAAAKNTDSEHAASQPSNELNRPLHPASYVKQTSGGSGESGENRTNDGTASQGQAAANQSALETGPKRGAELRGFRPKDPFDPQIFNRRFETKPR